MPVQKCEERVDRASWWPGPTQHGDSFIIRPDIYAASATAPPPPTHPCYCTRARKEVSGVAKKLPGMMRRHETRWGMRDMMVEASKLRRRRYRNDFSCCCCQAQQRNGRRNKSAVHAAVASPPPPTPPQLRVEMKQTCGVGKKEHEGVNKMRHEYESELWSRSERRIRIGWQSSSRLRQTIWGEGG